MNADARACFPHMPDELFNMWIRPHIEFSGWPFRGDETVVSDPAWAKYLRNHPPSFWRGVQWRFTSQAFIGVVIEQRAINVAYQLSEFGRQFIETGTAVRTPVKDSPKKVAAIATVLEKEMKFPKPLVCLVQGNEWWLMDGHHRLAAMFMQKEIEHFPFDAWIGTHDL